MGEQLPMHPVLTLTEEELLVLTGGHLGVVPPRIQVPQDEESAALMHTMATRTLMARGLILPAGILQQRHEGAGPGWEATEPLGLTLSLRELAPVVLGLQRVLGPLPGETDAGGQEESTVAVRYLHLHREVAVIEDVTPDGMHSLLPAFPERYLDAIADFIRPPEAVPGQGAARTGGSGERPGDGSDVAVAELLAALEHPTVLVEVVIQRIVQEGEQPPETSHQMLALGPGGTFRSRDSLTYHPVDPDEAIGDLLEEALEQVAAGGSRGTVTMGE